MIFEHNDKTKELIARVEAFMDKHVYPNEVTYNEQWKLLVLIDGKFLKFWKI